jgi:hypothetical protein
LRAAGYTNIQLKVTRDLLGKYLAYLIEIGFMERPQPKELPKVVISNARREALSRVEGRGKV